MIYETTPTRVLRAEYLAAIALQTVREKDRHRVGLLLEQAAIDNHYLSGVLMRHGLEAVWSDGSPRT
jgi:hypothetical protein